MVQQLQLIEVSNFQRNGHTALRVLLSRLSQNTIAFDSAVVYCKKIGVLNIHDIKDVVATFKTSQIDPCVAELLFNLKCSDHQHLYQKSVANAWSNRSFDPCFIQARANQRLQACRLIAQWWQVGAMDVEGTIKSRMWNAMIGASEEMATYIKAHPPMVSLFFQRMGENKYDAPSAVKVVQTLNRIADVLSIQQCQIAKEFCQNNNLWETSHCENIYTRVAHLQKKILLNSVSVVERSVLRKM